MDVITKSVKCTSEVETKQGAFAPESSGKFAIQADTFQSRYLPDKQKTSLLIYALQLTEAGSRVEPESV